MKMGKRLGTEWKNEIAKLLGFNRGNWFCRIYFLEKNPNQQLF